MKPVHMYFGLTGSVTHKSLQNLGPRYFVCIDSQYLFQSQAAFQSLPCIFIVYIIKRKLHVSSKIWRSCSRSTNNISPVCCTHLWDIACATQAYNTYLLTTKYYPLFYYSLIKLTFHVCKGLLCLYNKQNNTWLLVDII